MGTLHLGAVTFQGHNSSEHLLDAPPGSILQFQYQANKTQRTITQTGGTKADSGFDAVTITPRSQTSIILLEFSACCASHTGARDTYLEIRFSVSGGSYNAVPGMDSNQGNMRFNMGGQYHGNSCVFRYPHDHNTTNTLSYKIYGASSLSNDFKINWDQTFGMFSAMEIAT